MRWRGRRISTNVEDRRTSRPRRAVVGGGVGGIVLLLILLLLGADPRIVLNQLLDAQLESTPSSTISSAEEDEMAAFVSVILAETEDVWHQLFQQMGKEYRDPHLVLFSGQVRSACGVAGASVGPFYCPGDSKLYIDLTFYDELSRKFHAPGDFAQAYVIAHEVGHHVQNLLGISDQVQAMRGRVGEAEYNRLSVRMELQADYYAGVWAHHAERANNLLEAGDIEEGLRAAAAIGDDRLQRQSQGFIVPDSFTHGTSEQRVRWFRRGFESGDIQQGDTFSARDL